MAHIAKNFHSEREGWFVPIIILTSVHVQTCSDRVFLIDVHKIIPAALVCPTFPRQGSSCRIPNLIILSPEMYPLP